MMKNLHLLINSELSISASEWIKKIVFIPHPWQFCSWLNIFQLNLLSTKLQQQQENVKVYYNTYS